LQLAKDERRKSALGRIHGELLKLSFRYTHGRADQGIPSQGYYEANADRLLKRYEAVSFEEVHSELLPLLVGRTGDPLDVG
jgi:hypothetical protein